jgi:hypothetical protein
MGNRTVKRYVIACRRKEEEPRREDLGARVKTGRLVGRKTEGAAAFRLLNKCPSKLQISQKT